MSVGEEEANQAPTVEVSPGLLCKSNEWVPLYARANDDLRPFGVPLTARWEQISGPGQVSFESSDKLNTRASFPSLGTYQLRVTVSDSEFSDSADVTVYVTKNPRAFSRRLGASASEYAAVIPRDGTSVGYLRVLVNGSATFSAQLWLEGEVRRFKGTLVAGAWNPFDSTDMRLRFALTDDGEALNCSISRFTWETQFVAPEVAPSVLKRTGATAARAGAYTFMIVPQGSPLDSDPVGAGRITVSPSGYFKIKNGVSAFSKSGCGSVVAAVWGELESVTARMAAARRRGRFTGYNRSDTLELAPGRCFAAVPLVG